MFYVQVPTDYKGCNNYEMQRYNKNENWKKYVFKNEGNVFHAVF